jgi:hypothetical protein
MEEDNGGRQMPGEAVQRPRCRGTGHAVQTAFRYFVSLAFELQSCSRSRPDYADRRSSLMLRWDPAYTSRPWRVRNAVHLGKSPTGSSRGCSSTRSVRRRK